MLQSKYVFPIAIISICWIVQLLNMTSGYWFTHNFGTIPRDLSGLWGILFSPFLHGGLAHIISNTFGFLILSFVMLNITKEKYDYLELTLIMSVLTGILVWLLAGSGIHIGISGVIFSYFGFIIASSLYSFKLKNILISMPVFLFYGTMIIGILPLRVGVSWESHLFGLIVGFMVGKFYFKSKLMKDE